MYFSVVEEWMDFGSVLQDSEIHTLCRPVIPPSITITFKLLVCLLTFVMMDDTTAAPSILSLTQRGPSHFKPCNPGDQHHLHHSIATEFSPTNKFVDWATRYAVEKLANCATAAIHRRDELQKWLKINAEKQKQAKAAKKPRHKIPA